MPYGTYFPSRSTQGRTLGIVGLMLSIIPSFTIGGIVLSIIALVESRRAKVRNVPAVVGICVGMLYVLISIGALVFTLYSDSEPYACDQLGPGTHVQNGTTYSCGTAT